MSNVGLTYAGEDSGTTRLQLFKVVFAACNALLVPNTCAAMAMMYLHDYMDFIRDRLEMEQHKYLIVIAVIFIACKESEHLRTFRDVFNVTLKSMNSELTSEELDEVGFQSYVPVLYLTD